MASVPGQLVRLAAAAEAAAINRKRLPGWGVAWLGLRTAGLTEKTLPIGRGVLLVDTSRAAEIDEQGGMDRKYRQSHLDLPLRQTPCWAREWTSVW
jgi:hypothetical protein